MRPQGRGGGGSDDGAQLLRPSEVQQVGRRMVSPGEGDRKEREEKIHRDEKSTEVRRREERQVATMQTYTTEAKRELTVRACLCG